MPATAASPAGFRPGVSIEQVARRSRFSRTYANGDGRIAPYRNSANASRVIVRNYADGAAFAAAHPSYSTEQLASPPAD